MAENTPTLAELQAEYKEKIAKALAAAKTKLKTELDLAVLTFQAIAEAGEQGIWQSPTIAPILSSLGLQPVSQPAKRGRKAGTKNKTAKTDLKKANGEAKRARKGSLKSKLLAALSKDKDMDREAIIKAIGGKVNKNYLGVLLSNLKTKEKSIKSGDKRGSYRLK